MENHIFDGRCHHSSNGDVVFVCWNGLPPPPPSNSEWNEPKQKQVLGGGLICDLVTTVSDDTRIV